MKHTLLIESLHDAQAHCSCRHWAMSRTGIATKKEIIELHNRHAKAEILFEAFRKIRSKNYEIQAIEEQRDAIICNVMRESNIDYTEYNSKYKEWLMLQD